jgi:hypothetical protein
VLPLARFPFPKLENKWERRHKEKERWGKGKGKEKEIKDTVTVLSDRA